MKIFGIIYKVTNIVNGKIYIGQTIQTLKYRRNAHLIDKRNCYFHNALSKYGKKNFEWVILEHCSSKEELDEMEFHYIKQYKSNFKQYGYNMTLGGEGTLGIKRSKEYRLKQSIAQSGKTVPIEVRKKISRSMMGSKNHFYGKKHSLETRQLISIKNKGKAHPQTEEVKKKISQAKKGISRSPETIRKMSENTLGDKHWRAGMFVITTPKNEEFVIKGLNHFCRLYNKDILHSSNLINVANGKRRQHKGYKCRYYNRELDYNLHYWECNCEY